MTVVPARDRPYVFISYASVDRDRVLSLVGALRESGIPAWVDQADITGGVSYGPEITAGIKESRALVLMCSAASLASRNVAQEIQLAWRFDRPILPLLLEPVSFPDNLVYWLEGAQWIETFGDGQSDWLRRLRQALAQRGYPSVAEAAQPGVAEPKHGDQDMPPNNLPQITDVLVGRDRELRQIQALVANGRLITITGIGGVGKTRLALEVAARTAPAYPHGVWFIDGSADRSAVELERTIAATIGAVEGPGESTFDAIARRLGDDAILLVIDNLEQIADAREALSHLIEHCSGLRVMCTSRAATRARGELVFPVSGLSVPADGSSVLAIDVAQNPAVALFVSRARRARPDFAISDANAAAVSAICARLDGLPLAIELAAARARMLPPAAILERLENSLTLLTRSGSAISGRQSTLRSTIAWSYDLLSPEAQGAFRALAAFSGGGTVPAVEAVIGTPDALDALDDLVDQSLLRLDASTGAEEQMRVRMLETVRDYASEQLRDSGEEQLVRARHSAWYLDTATDIAGQVEESANAELLDRLEADQPNLRAALRFLGSGSDDDKTAALRMANALWRFWWTRGHLEEGYTFLRQTLEQVPDAPAEIRASALISAAIIAEARGQLDASSELLDTALDLLDGADHPHLLARALSSRGTTAEIGGDLMRARECHERALAIYRELGAERKIAVTLHHLSSVLTSAAEYERAKSLVEDSLAIFRAHGDMQSIAYALQQLGIIALHQGDFAQAAAAYEETIAITESLGDRLGQGNGLLNLGSALDMSGDFDGALSRLEQARLIFSDIQDAGGVGFVEYLAGHTLRAQGNPDEGRTRLIAAIKQLAAVGDRQALAEAMEALAGVELDLNRARNAAVLIGHAERIREESGSPVPLNRVDEVHRDRASIVRELGSQAFAEEAERGRQADPAELLALVQRDR